MPRLFGSSSASPASARSIHQQQQEESRRRSNFAFMKYTPERRTNASMRRSREHAKQIAMKMEQASPSNQTTTPFVDFDPFPTTEQTTTTTPQSSNVQNVDGAYNMDMIDSSSRRRNKRQDLDAFVQQQQQQQNQRNGGTTMPTFPSNSTMQSRNVSSSSSSSTSTSGGAARRRMARAQKYGASSKISDVGVNHHYPHVEFDDDFSTTSPYPLTRSGSSKANHLLNYAQTPRAPIAATPTSNRSINSSSQSSLQQDAFGFSFDAFGLDETEVDLEVKEALTSLVHGSRPDLGFFLEEEFPMHNFDSSRGSTPTSEVDGFTDGFRLVNSKQSPTSSERSSLTSGTNEYNSGGGVNRFKVQAGFHKSSSPSTITRTSLGRPPVSPYAKSEPGGHYTRMESSPQPFPIMPNLLKQEQDESFPQVNFDDDFPDPEPNVFDDSDDDYGPKSSFTSHRTTAPSPQAATTTTTTTTTTTIKEKIPTPPTSDVGAYSDAGARSDVGVMMMSDSGARSDVGVNSDVGARSDVGVNSDVGVKSDVAFASDVGVASDGGANSDIGQVPTDIMGKLRNKKSAAQRAEEEEARRVKDLKHAWERRQQEEANEAAERLKRRQSARSPLPQAEIARLEKNLGDELLSPEILERKQVRGTTVSMLKSVKKNAGVDKLNRAAECNEQRTSFASYRERLKPANFRNDGKKDYGSAKSDIGGYGRPPSEMNAVLNRFNKQKSFGDSPRDSFGESRSDVGGGSPSFLANVKLRSTGGATAKDTEQRIQKDPRQFEDSQSSFEAGPSQYGDEFGDSNEFRDEFGYDDEQYDEGSYYSDDDSEWMRQQEDDFFGDESSDEPKPPKKMTYREKRELELKAERERKEAEEKANKEPELDVAALIRKRIAANKKAAAQAAKEKSESTENISDMRNRLRKVTVDDKQSPRQPPSAAKKFVASSPSNQPPSAAQKFLERSSPEFSVKQLKKPMAPDDESPVQSSSDVKRQDLTVETKQDWPGSSESTSPNMHPPSMVSSEVDSSSTARTYEEVSPSLQKRQPAPEVPEARNFQSEISREELEQHDAQVQSETASQDPVPNVPQHSEERNEPSQTVAIGAVEEESISASNATAKNALTALLGKRMAPPVQPAPEPTTASEKEDVSSALMKMHFQQDARKLEEETSPSKETSSGGSGRPALKDDPKYARYFRMLKVGMPMEVVKHAMTRDDLDPSVMDGDHNKPAGGIPLKEDPKFARYFKMLAMGLPMGAVKNAMERDGLDPAIMDGDHNLPAGAGLSKDDEPVDEDKPKDTHRRTRLHWETLRQVRASSLWAKIDNDPELEQIDIDEDEFAELFQAELTPVPATKGLAGSAGKRKGAAVRVIESKRANNGGIILARLKMTHDEMADAVDRIDENAMTAEQMENIIEYLPTKEERKALEAYMLEGDQDAAEKFDGLCECEKFMVAMMTVKHAKRKVRALLFKLQFEGCLDSLEHDVAMVESACDELKNSVRLRKLLGIVLNIGNRLNTAGAAGKRKAGAFSLNSLLKLSQAKAFDKKTTFLQYVILVVQRNNEILLNFKDDIPTALKADKVYWDQCLSDLEDVENQLENVRRMALYQARLAQTYQLQKKKPQGDDDDESLSDASMTLEEEVEALRASAIGLFTLGAIKKVSALRDKVEATKTKFAKLLEYFGEEHRRDMQPHDLFAVFATFSRDFDSAKEKVIADEKRKKREERKRQAGGTSKRGLKASTPPGKSTTQQQPSGSPEDSITSPKSDAGVRYSSYNDAYPFETAPNTRSQRNNTESSSTMQQHLSTMNGMYETPKQLARKTRSSPSSGGPRDREAALRQKARMRRRMQEERPAPPANDSPEVGRPPRSAEKGLSPRSNVRKQRREEQRRSRVQDQVQL